MIKHFNNFNAYKLNLSTIKSKIYLKNEECFLWPLSCLLLEGLHNEVAFPHEDLVLEEYGELNVELDDIRT